MGIFGAKVAGKAVTLDGTTYNRRPSESVNVGVAVQPGDVSVTWATATQYRLQVGDRMQVWGSSDASAPANAINIAATGPYRFPMPTMPVAGQTLVGSGILTITPIQSGGGTEYLTRNVRIPFELFWDGVSQWATGTVEPLAAVSILVGRLTSDRVIWPHTRSAEEWNGIEVRTFLKTCLVNGVTFRTDYHLTLFYEMDYQTGV